MKLSFIILTLFLCSGSSFSQYQFEKLYHAPIKNQAVDYAYFTDQKSQSFNAARTSEIVSAYVLDSIVSYKFTSENDSIPFELKTYVKDSYGNNTLITTYNWDEQLQNWKPLNKLAYKIIPKGRLIERNTHYKWANEAGWVTMNDLHHYWNGIGKKDSTTNFGYSNTGALKYANKTYYKYNDDLNQIIKEELVLNLNDNKWKKNSLTETYLNDQGDIDLETRLKWDDSNSNYVYDQKLVYKWDSEEFNLIISFFHFENESSSWIVNRKVFRTNKDENGLVDLLYESWDVEMETTIITRISSLKFSKSGKLTSHKTSIWDDELQKMHPVSENIWEYDSLKEQKVSFVQKRNLNELSGIWANIKSETYFYNDQLLLSQTHKFNLDVENNVKVLIEKYFRFYHQKDIISNKPESTDLPIGKNILCINAENTIYKTRWEKDVTSFKWKILPEDAGILSEGDSMVTINWNNDYSGIVSLAVAGVNGFGVGPYSDTFKISIQKYLPSQPPTPSGPMELNQFSESAIYQIPLQEITDNYIWLLYPENAGLLTSEKNTTIFELNENYEGEFNISIMTKNACGLSLESDQLLAKVAYITGFEDRYNYGEINIYPNPTNDRVNISYKDIDQLKSIKIIDLKGESIWQSNSNTIIRSSEINLNLQKGIYIMLLELKERIISKKLVVN